MRLHPCSATDTHAPSPVQRPVASRASRGSVGVLPQAEINQEDRQSTSGYERSLLPSPRPSDISARVAQQQQPTGGVFHAASFDDAGRIHVADVWESDAMNDLLPNVWMPAMKKLSIAPPDVSVYPVHNISAYKSVDKHKI